MSRPIPILFIHGFDGRPTSWDEWGWRDRLVSLGADPDLLRLFHYGWREGEGGFPRLYNSQGDIRAIAARLTRRESDDPDTLASQLLRLSQASVARGGPSQVTIIAHSMGGLVARYYLSRSQPDEYGTVNEGVVGRLITLATPHLGVEMAQVVHLVPPDSLVLRVLRWLERAGLTRGHPSEALLRAEAQVHEMQSEAQAAAIPVSAQGYLDSPAVRQMVPGSDFLRALSAPGAFPEEVESILIWGDVQLKGAVRWGPLPLWSRTVTLGDLLVSAASASELPGLSPARYGFVWEREIEVRVGDPGMEPAGLNDLLPPVSHSNLPRNPEVQALVARLLGF